MVYKKEIPLYYISNLLYRKNVNNYRDYLSLNENRKLLAWSYKVGQEHIKLAKNKLFFEELMVKNGIPTPRVYFFNTKNTFTYNGADYTVATKNDLLTFLKTVFTDLDVDSIFCKPIDAGMGRHIFQLNRNSYQSIKDELISLVLSSSFIFQEKVIQHEALKAINSSSINTMRIATYRSADNGVEILSGFIRVGRKGAIIDNAHAGGIVLPITLESGKIGAEGLQLIDNGGGIFYEHPDSGVAFKDYQIPFFKEAQQMVVKASRLFDIPLLGWDVAITPEGPIIIEVNHDFHLLLSDRMERGLKRNASFRKLVDDVV